MDDTEDEEEPSGTEVRSCESDNSWKMKGTAVDVDSDDESSDEPKSCKPRS